MITQPVDPHHYVRKARQLKAQIPICLSQWGLLPKFKRWRLAQDPETGTVVLFGVLDTHYIATHATTPFSDYFDPRLLRDLATELHVQVIPSANDGLRYAFILERGALELLPEPLQVQEPVPAEPAPAEPVKPTAEAEHNRLHQRLDKFLEISAALALLENTTPPQPDVLLLDEAQFNQQMADYEARRNAQKPL